jgi:hypothetical protein
VTSLRIGAFAVGATVLVQTAGTARTGNGGVRRRCSSFGLQPLTANKRTRPRNSWRRRRSKGDPKFANLACRYLSGNKLGGNGVTALAKFSEHLKEGTRHNEHETVSSLEIPPLPARQIFRTTFTNDMLPIRLIHV